MSSNYRTGTVGEPEPLFYDLSSAYTGLYLQCQVQKQGSAAPEQTVDLTEVSYNPGCYEGTVTINIEGVYNLLYIAYIDAGHTTESEMAPRASEVMTVSLTSYKYSGVSDTGGVAFLLEDIENIAKSVSSKIKEINVWHSVLKSGRTAEEELIAKSEFDYKKDIVITEPIIIKEFNFDEIKSFISLEVAMLKNILSDTKVMSKLQEIEKNVSNIKPADLTELFVKISEMKQHVDNESKKIVIDALLEKTDKILLSIPQDNSKKIIDLMLRELANLKSELSNKKELISIEDRIKYVMGMISDNTELIKKIDELSSDKLKYVISAIKSDIAGIKDNKKNKKLFEDAIAWL